MAICSVSLDSGAARPRTAPGGARRDGGATGRDGGAEIGRGACAPRDTAAEPRAPPPPPSAPPPPPPPLACALSALSAACAGFDELGAARQLCGRNDGACLPCRVAEREADGVCAFEGAARAAGAPTAERELRADAPLPLCVPVFEAPNAVPTVGGGRARLRSLSSVGCSFTLVAALSFST
eukprot:5491369-Pleurochrysis_carterae.AAC.1